MRGDLRNAESHLLRAARASRQFAPRWEGRMAASAPLAAKLAALATSDDQAMLIAWCNA